MANRLQDTISVCCDALFVCDKKKNGRAIVTQEEDLAKMIFDLFGGLANDRKKATE
jgi:hypothetical protein